MRFMPDDVSLLQLVELHKWILCCYHTLAVWGFDNCNKSNESLQNDKTLFTVKKIPSKRTYPLSAEFTHFIDNSPGSFKRWIENQSEIKVHILSTPKQKGHKDFVYEIILYGSENSIASAIKRLEILQLKVKNFPDIFKHFFYAKNANCFILSGLKTKQDNILMASYKGPIFYCKKYKNKELVSPIRKDASLETEPTEVSSSQCLEYELFEQHWLQCFRRLAQSYDESLMGEIIIMVRFGNIIWVGENLTDKEVKYEVAVNELKFTYADMAKQCKMPIPVSNTSNTAPKTKLGLKGKEKKLKIQKQRQRNSAKPASPTAHNTHLSVHISKPKEESSAITLEKEFLQNDVNVAEPNKNDVVLNEALESNKKKTKNKKKKKQLTTGLITSPVAQSIKFRAPVTLPEEYSTDELEKPSLACKPLIPEFTNCNAVLNKHSESRRNKKKNQNQFNTDSLLPPAGQYTKPSAHTVMSEEMFSATALVQVCFPGVTSSEFNSSNTILNEIVHPIKKEKKKKQIQCNTDSLALSQAQIIHPKINADMSEGVCPTATIEKEDTQDLIVTSSENNNDNALPNKRFRLSRKERKKMKNQCHTDILTSSTRPSVQASVCTASLAEESSSATLNANSVVTLEECFQNEIKVTSPELSNFTAAQKKSFKAKNKGKQKKQSKCNTDTPVLSVPRSSHSKTPNVSLKEEKYQYNFKIMGTSFHPCNQESIKLEEFLHENGFKKDLSSEKKCICALIAFERRTRLELLLNENLEYLHFRLSPVHFCDIQVKASSSSALSKPDFRIQINTVRSRHNLALADYEYQAYTNPCNQLINFVDERPTEDFINHKISVNSKFEQKIRHIRLKDSARYRRQPHHSGNANYCNHFDNVLVEITKVKEMDDYNVAEHLFRKQDIHQEITIVIPCVPSLHDEFAWQRLGKDLYSFAQNLATEIKCTDTIDCR